MSSLNKHKLSFNPNMPNDCSSNIGVYLRDGYGSQLTSTDVDGYTHALDVFMQGFGPTISNEDGYLYVDFSPDLLSQDGYLQVVVTNPTPSASEYAEDSGHISGDLGTFTLGVRNDTNAVLTSNDLDYSAFAVDAYGRMKVVTDFDSSMLNEDGYLNVNLAAPVVVNVDNNFEHAEDFGHVSGDIGSFSLAVRRDALAAGAFTSNDADYAGFNVDAYGALWSDSVGSKFDGQADDGTDPSDRAVKIGARVFDLPLTTVGATDVRVDLAADSYRRLFINDSPNIGLLVSQNSVGLSSELLVAAALGGRRRMLIQNNADCAIYAGHDSSVSASNGFIIPGGDTLSLEIGDGLALWVIADEAASDVRVMELA